MTHYCVSMLCALDSKVWTLDSSKKSNYKLNSIYKRFYESMQVAKIYNEKSTSAKLLSKTLKLINCLQNFK